MACTPCTVRSERGDTRFRFRETECTYSEACIVNLESRLPECLTIAVDTEFRRELTLTVQAAARIAPRTIAVQIYRSHVLSEVATASFEEHHSLQVIRDQGHCDDFVIRPA